MCLPLQVGKVNGKWSYSLGYYLIRLLDARGDDVRWVDTEGGSEEGKTSTSSYFFLRTPAREIR